MAEVRNMNVVDAFDLVRDGALLLDVRDDNEWESGRAPNATHVSLNDVPDHLDELTDDRLIVCVCRSGIRSARAVMFLTEHGRDAVNVEGGMLAWSAEGLPLVADEGAPTIV